MTQQTTTVMIRGECVQVPFPLNANSIEGGAFDRISGRGDKSAMFERATMQKCVEAVALAYGVSIEAMLGKNRAYAIAHPRQLAYMLAREATGQSYTALGLFFGGRDHATIMHGIRVCVGRLNRSESERAKYDSLRYRFRDSPVAKLPAPVKAKLPRVQVRIAEPTVKAALQTRTCKCGTEFQTRQDYRFCQPCRDQMQRLA